MATKTRFCSCISIIIFIIFFTKILIELLYVDMTIQTDIITQITSSITENTNKYILSFYNQSSPKIFLYSCISFPNICNKLNITHIITMHQFNTHCNNIYNQLNKLNHSIVSQLFLLSFRREYISFINYFNISNQINTSTNICHHNIIYKFLSKVHYVYSNFHNPNNEIMLYHTHISKALGTTSSNTAIRMYNKLKRAHLLNHSKATLRLKTKRFKWPQIVHGRWIFKGVPSDEGSFSSCKWIYNYAKMSKLYRTHSEAPLSIFKICPQFYNSIILRDPI
eukprot:387709_1